MCWRPFSLFWAVVLLSFHVPARGADVWNWFADERIGTNSPDPSAGAVPLPEGGQLSLGSSKQWLFVAFTNSAPSTNVLFATIAAHALNPGPTNPSNEPDLDLYVSTNAALCSLDAESLTNSWRSLGRGARETVMIPDAPEGVFFVAVRCETSAEVEFSLLALASDTPFSETDPAGFLRLRGVPLPTAIPDASAAGPGVAYALAATAETFPVHRVIVSNTVAHEQFGDLSDALEHEQVSVRLAGRLSGDPGVRTFTWDDSDQADIANSAHTSGPGSLADYAGRNSAGQWLLTLKDLVPGGLGTNQDFSVVLERENDLSAGQTFDIGPQAGTEHIVTVPAAATNLTLTAGLLSGSGPVRVELLAVDNPAASPSTTFLSDAGDSVSIAKDKYSEEPLNSVRYSIRLSNGGDDLATITLLTSITRNPSGAPPLHFSAAHVVPIPGPGVATASLSVPVNQRVISANPGVRIQHPRISDLQLSLISPSGKRVLLSDRRGGLSSEGMGRNTVVTNIVPVSASGGPLAATNIIDVGESAGTVSIQYDFLELPDEMHVYRGTMLIFESGMVSQSGNWTIPFGPDNSGRLTIVMNEGGNYDPDTAWNYTVITTRPGFQFVLFTENRDGALPVKFAPPPFTNSVPPSLDASSTNILRLIPEESLQAFAGEPANGEWKLEIADLGARPGDNSAALLAWELDLVLEDAAPAPFPLAHDVSRSAVVAPGAVQQFLVEVPPWAHLTTNDLVTAEKPVQLWFNPVSPPSGTNAADTLLASGIESTSLVFSGTTVPAISPGSHYYLGVRNTNSVPVAITFELSLDVQQLTASLPAQVSLSSLDPAAYYSFNVSSNAANVVVRLSGLSGNLELIARKDSLPDANTFDFGSFNPETQDEQILISTSSAPVPLTPGRWYAGLLNPGGQPIQGTLVFTEFGPPISISAVLPGGAVQLTWEAPPGATFQVQWSPSLESASWKAFAAVVSSTTGNFSFTDDGTETGGSDVTRFYRILRVL